MGWQSDWLYGLIFAEVRKIVAEANKYDARFGNPPAIFRIDEHAVADWVRVHCRGAAERRWTLAGGRLSLELHDDPTHESERRNIDGMFYDEGRMAFHISPDRRRVLFTYLIGPRYGRGTVLEVEGQGSRARLVPYDGYAWIS